MDIFFLFPTAKLKQTKILLRVGLVTVKKKKKKLYLKNCIFFTRTCSCTSSLFAPESPEWFLSTSFLCTHSLIHSFTCVLLRSHYSFSHLLFQHTHPSISLHITMLSDTPLISPHLFIAQSLQVFTHRLNLAFILFPLCYGIGSISASSWGLVIMIFQLFNFFIVRL